MAGDDRVAAWAPFASGLVFFVALAGSGLLALRPSLELTQRTPQPQASGMDCDLAVRIESRRALSLYEEATLDLQRGFDGGDREHLLRALASCDEALGVLSRLPASPQTECALSSDVPRLEDLVRSLKTLCGKALAERG